MSQPLPIPYSGRNGPKDVAQRLWDVEGTRVPSLQQQIDDLADGQGQDAPIDPVLLFENALI